MILAMIPVQGTQNNEKADRLIIGLDSAGSKPALLETVKDHDGVWLKEIPAINAVVITIPEDLRAGLISDLTLNKHVRFVEDDIRISIPELKVTIAKSDSVQLIPDDPGYPLQWGMRMIQANYTWDVTTGNKNVIVAVIDTGVDYDHADLAAVDASIGWDFVNNDPYAMDDNGHGTHVAGIVAATINNNEGVVGVAPGITVMPVKVLEDAAKYAVYTYPALARDRSRIVP